MPQTLGHRAFQNRTDHALALGSTQPGAGERLLASIDYWLFLPALLITLEGLYVQFKVLQAGYAGSFPGNFIKQTGAVFLGLILCLLFTWIEEPTLKLLSRLLYGLSILLLIYEKVDHYSLKGATGADSWIRVPFVGSFQPSELAKIAIALLAAELLVQIKNEEKPILKGMAQLAALYGVPLLLIIKEPDFGTAVVILVMLFATLFCWGISRKVIGAGVLLVLVTIPLAWFFYFTPIQKNRILPYLFPGSQLVDTYNLDQARKAIASGGWLGNQSGVDVHVPIKESDFVYSAVSEHLGFLGTTLLILLVGLFLGRALWVARRAALSNQASGYTAVALIASFSAHFIENMGMNVGLLPITGIPLPFVSNGGTSMVMNYIALGLLMNAAANLKAADRTYH